MPFLKGIEPIRYTLKYLEAGKVYLKDTLQIFSVNYNTSGGHHEGARQFVFWYLPQLQYKNSHVQIVTLRNLTPSPFITCYFKKDDSFDKKSNNKNSLHFSDGYHADPIVFRSPIADNNEKMLIDVDSKGKDEILEHVIKVIGKPATVIKNLIIRVFCRSYAIASKTEISEKEGTNSNINILKREKSEDTCSIHDNGLEAKRISLFMNDERVRRRKMAMLISYRGTGYLGLQRNPGTKTIEEDLLVAMLKAGCITYEIFQQPQLIDFQRAARTDKGVSAIRQILSLKLPESVDVDKINEHLPEQIRAIAVKRVTKGFSSKSNCDARTYSYTTPTFAFTAYTKAATEDYRICQETLDHVSRVVKTYEGTHNFHNFTSKRLPSDPSSARFIMSFTCGEPFIADGLEFVTLKVKGQSFMLHQIRKMVALAIAVVRGMTNIETVTRAWDKDKLDIPIAPGLGLLLEEVHYDRYNVKYGDDGVHEWIDWEKYESQVEEFRRKFIWPSIVEFEKSEKSMLTWLETLGMHSFETETENLHSSLDRALEKNKDMLTRPNKTDVLSNTDFVVDTER